MPSDKIVEVLLKSIEESMVSARQAEAQRATITNYIVTISAALLAFVVQQRFLISTLPASLFIGLIGLFGILSSMKFGQHYHIHWVRVYLFQKRLDELCPEARLEAIRKESYEMNHQLFPITGKRIKIIHLWSALHISIISLGIGCAIATAILNN